MEVCKEIDVSKYKKIPKNILVCSANSSYKPALRSRVDYSSEDVEYDLLVYVDWRFQLRLKHPFSIANAEIWFERGDTFTQDVFERALSHYSECEIRNGK